MDDYIHRYQISKLNQDEISHLNSPLNPKEVEAPIKSLPTNKSPGPDGFRAQFYQTVKKDLISILFKIFHKIETEGTLPSSLYEATVALISKPQKDPTKKENFRPIYLMNTAKILNKFLQEYIKMIIHHD
jgi:hypothetical protein